MLGTNDSPVLSEHRAPLPTTDTCLPTSTEPAPWGGTCSPARVTSGLL